jgi:hypothetical protein
MIKKIKSKVEMQKANNLIPNLIGNLQNRFKAIWVPALVHLERSLEAGMTKLQLSFRAQRREISL